MGRLDYEIDFSRNPEDFPPFMRERDGDASTPKKIRIYVEFGYFLSISWIFKIAHVIRSMICRVLS